eukprot:1157533-Pelagomonas_calceolata.AAC.3
MTPDQGICTLSKIEVYAGQQQACIKESPIVNASGMHSEFHQLHTSSRHDDLVSCCILHPACPRQADQDSAKRLFKCAA